MLRKRSQELAKITEMYLCRQRTRSALQGVSEFLHKGIY